MKAAYIHSTCRASGIQIGQLDCPTLQPNQVLVRMAAVSVNPIDLYIRSGMVKAALPNPYILGCDIAGTVEQVGPAALGLAVGDRVWASNQGLAGRQGTFAEFSAIDQEWLYRTPKNVSDSQAAAGALTGITAHLGLHLHGGLQLGEVVFVNGGTGGVGSAVVQIAKAAGATVITTVGSDEKEHLAKDLGADHVINYRQQNPYEALAELVAATGKVNVWFETHRDPSPEHSFPLMARRGRYVLMAGRDAKPLFPVGPFYVNDLRAIGFAMFNATPPEQRAAADHLNELMSAGKLKPIIGQTFKLDDAAAAHELQEANSLNNASTLTGKIVLVP
jgi:NADPH:quinone reductase